MRPSVDLLHSLAEVRGLPPRPLPASREFVTSDGQRLHYLEWAGGPEALVLLHGGGLTGHTFDLLALALGEGVRCIAVDLRGHGLSDWGDSYTIDRSAEDVVELADHLAASRVHLAGMSLGACIAGHAAARLGDRLASLALIDVAPAVNFTATAKMRRFMAETDPTAPLETIVAAALATSPRTDPDLMLYRYQSLLRPDGGWRADRRRPTDFAHILGRLAELHDVAPRIACPTLVVQGGRSRVLTRKDGRAFADRFAKGRWVVIPDAGHNVQEEQPAALAYALLDLIQTGSHPMSLIPLFVAQREAFEAVYEDDDWSRLAPFFHEDVRYEVMNMPFACVLEGREAMFAGIRRSITGFDKHCKRTLGLDRIVREEGDNVIIHSRMVFERPGAPPTSSKVWEIATYRDGRISRLIDLYDPEAASEYEQWMAAWGQGLDASYA